MSSAVADTSVGLSSKTLPPVASAVRMYEGSTFPEQGQPVWDVGRSCCAVTGSDGHKTRATQPTVLNSI